MHLTDHVTDDQLNEYLDNETTPEGRAQIESHVSACDECAARLSALQTLFEEIESLPELTPSLDLAARVRPTPSLPIPQLPRWLTLTAILQAASALVAMIFTTPIISQYLAPILETYPVPSLKDVMVELLMNYVMWMQSMQSLQFPTIPTGILTLPKELSTTTLSVSVMGIFFLWAIGNWWLLRKRSDSLA